KDYGFKDAKALKKAIEASGPEFKDTLSMIENERVEFVIRRPSEGRWWVPRVGFQNQRITRSSKGILNEAVRDAGEAKLASIDPIKYAQLDQDLKPKYGYLRAKAGENMTEPEGALPYGEDAYILKKENLRDRTTFTIGDSLINAKYREETSDW